METATKVTSLRGRPEARTARRIRSSTAAREGGGHISSYWTIARTAAYLRRRAGSRKTQPAVLVFTDPNRTPDPIALAERLPRGVALVYRAFGAIDTETVARQLLAIAKRRGFLLLIGADAKLAAKIRADGVHLPERLAHLAPRIRRKTWLITAAAHSPRAARASWVDAVVVSTIFASTSPSAGRPIGPIRLAMIVGRTGKSVYALGGITEGSASHLRGTGVVGIAAVDAFRT